MRLRYLHLPDYGVLKDLKVVFREETILQRDGSLQFVVGLNGTGKSSLLRAVYETFRWLEAEDVPPFPVAMVYELNRDDDRSMVVFRHLDRAPSKAVFSVVPEGWHCWEAFVGDATEIDWEALLGAVDDEEVAHGDFWARSVHGDQFIGNQQLREHLPKPLLAYTSGDIAAWRKVREPELRGDELAELVVNGVGDDQDRPRGWNVHRELATADVPIENAQRRAMREQMAPDDAEADATCLLLEQVDLKLAAIAVGLTVAARELGDRRTDRDMAAWRDGLQNHVVDQQRGKRPTEKEARTLLNEIDWWWPTHMSVRYRPTTARMNAEWHAQWLAMCALADEVVSQPLGRMQMVIDLGPGQRDIGADVKGAYGDRAVPVEVREVIDRLSGSASGAEAVVRTLSSERMLPLWDVFQTLRAWRAGGLIEDATVTVKRVTPMSAHDGQPDDVVLTWDDFSDGEQMLLGRMALLLLLRGQHGGMLLLDEPETHFNDAWKREIIDIVDDNVLKGTRAQVVVATHTSIALTDAFASEIVRLVRSDGQAVLKPVSFPTFGAEPGRVMLHVFDMAASIGTRAEQALRERLAQDWTGENRDELGKLVSKIGGGWPRARLQQILDELTNASPGS